jgi:hypothetical protein
MIRGQGIVRHKHKCGQKRQHAGHNHNRHFVANIDQFQSFAHLASLRILFLSPSELLILTPHVNTWILAFPDLFLSYHHDWTILALLFRGVQAISSMWLMEFL